MRGPDEKQGEVFSYVPLEDRIPRDHPLRRIRPMVDRGLNEMWTHFEALYARRGRPSIAPERLLRALLLQALYSIRSETQLMEQLDYNLLYRWFVGLNPDDPVWDVTVFTKNRERLMAGDVSQRLLEAVLRQAGEHDLLIEDRNGRVTAAMATQSSTSAEREAALAMLDQRGRSPGQVNEQTRSITLGADKLYQEKEFITGLRERKVIPHVAEYEPNPHWPNWLTDQERHDPGYAISQRKRKLIEKVFGWAKLDSILRQVKVRGVKKVNWLFRLLATAANLVRLVKLI